MQRFLFYPLILIRVMGAWSLIANISEGILNHLEFIAKNKYLKFKILTCYLIWMPPGQENSIYQLVDAFILLS